jgi:hypothetical protein
VIVLLNEGRRVAGGPIGRLFDARVGNEMVATVGEDLASSRRWPRSKLDTAGSDAGEVA